MIYQILRQSRSGGKAAGTDGLSARPRGGFAAAGIASGMKSIAKGVLRVG